jgi:hypothetical protein
LATPVQHAGGRGLPFKPAVSAPFRLSVRPNNNPAHGRSRAAEVVPGSGRARRRPSESSFEAPSVKRREESPPPTKPSIVPPVPSRAKANQRPISGGSPFAELERAAPTLTYGIVLVLGGVTLGLGGLLAASSSGRGGPTWLSGTLGFCAVGTLIFSLSMAVVITLSFARRLNALALAAERVAQVKADRLGPHVSGDAVASLARSLGSLSARVSELTLELERQSEREQGSLDALVRLRTRDLVEENDDLRRALGPSKGLLGVDTRGRIVGHCSPIISTWLGTVPTDGNCWDYFDRAVRGAGQRFQEAFAALMASTPGELDLQRMPRNLAVGERYLALEYRAVRDLNGAVVRVLVLLSDISIPEPDPATSS